MHRHSTEHIAPESKKKRRKIKISYHIVVYSVVNIFSLVYRSVNGLYYDVSGTKEPNNLLIDCDVTEA